MTEILGRVAANTLYNLIPLNGKSAGNMTLKKQYDASFTAENHTVDYWAARKELLDAGLIQTGRGKGGSVRRTSLSAETPVNEEVSTFFNE